MRVVLTNEGFLFSEMTHTDETDLRRAEKLLIHLFSQEDEYTAGEIYDLGNKQGLSVDILKKAKSKLPIEAIHPDPRDHGNGEAP